MSDYLTLNNQINELHTFTRDVDEGMEEAFGEIDALRERLNRLECREDGGPCIADHQLQLDHLHDVQQGILDRVAKIEGEVLFDGEREEEPAEGPTSYDRKTRDAVMEIGRILRGITLNPAQADDVRLMALGRIPLPMMAVGFGLRSASGWLIGDTPAGRRNAGNDQGTAPEAPPLLDPRLATTGLGHRSEDRPGPRHACGRRHRL